MNEDRPLSPASVDSEEERQLLEQVNSAFSRKSLPLLMKYSFAQAFVAGQARILAQKSSNTTSSHSSSAATVQTVNTVNVADNQDAGNDDDDHSSISSIGSNDSNELLQQCIQVGISKTNQIAQTKPQPANKTAPKVIPSNQAKRSQLPTPKASTSQPTTVTNHRSRSAKRDQDDKQLLMDCINAGIERNIRSKSTVIEKSSPNSPSKYRIESEQTTKNMPSKNVQTTSAITVYRTAGATDVVVDKQKGTACVHGQHQPAAKPAQIMNSKADHDQSIHIIGDIIEITATAAPTSSETGYNNSALNTSTLSTKSHNSFNMGCELSLLERSNECPACLGQGESMYDSEHSSSVDMEVSNECLFEHLSPPRMDKHKDPNLMLQSVDRLTHELVSTAEFLRTASSIDDDDVTLTDSKITFSISNDTWNEDTNLNEVPFPKMSQEAPVIESLYDDDTTISFEIGGKVNNQNVDDHKVNGFDSHSTSTMTNSTIIAMEANKIRNQLLKDNKNDSIISLDKIQPPSFMDKLSISSCCESLTSGSSLNRSPMRILTQGFMARRALQNNAGSGILGSNDSIDSSCNLDRVKPPSIMDGLLDSMASVDSLVSEYIDVPAVQPNEDPSHYETALSECDDTTITLKNCADLPFDNTPYGSDFSSAESTPKKGRRSITPRRKRQLNRDRYQTFTILDSDPEAQPNPENNMNLIAAHGDDKEGFHLQMSNHPLLINGSDSDAISLVSSDGDVSSIRVITKNLPHFNDISIQNDVSINTNTYVKQPSASKLNNSTRTPQVASAPRIIKPNQSTAPAAIDPEKESKAIRGQKKPAYVSPYSITNLTKSAPKYSKPPTKVVMPKIEPPKSVEKASKTKSFIQRSAESLKKMRPSFTSKLTKQSPSRQPSGSTDEKNSLNRQKSTGSMKTPDKLVRQGTFTMDEPSDGKIPVIVSEPTSPRKTKNLVSKIPFNRATSLQATRNVTKSNTNIDISLPRNASSTFIRRTLKSASSTSQISTPSSRGSLSPRQSLDSPSSSKSIFNRWTPPNKKVSPLPTSAPKLSAVKTPSRESIGSVTSPRSAIGNASKIGTCRSIPTSGRSAKV